MEISTAKNYNVIVMSFAFMLVFTGFNTMSGIQVMTMTMDCWVGKWHGEEERLLPELV